MPGKRFSNHAVRRLPGASLLIALAAVFIQLSPGMASWLEYDRAAIATGQLWRVATCHLTHWSFDHLWWDAAALVILGALCEAQDRRAMLRCLTASAVLIPTAIAWLMPDLEFYRGLSGLDSALFVLLAGTILRESLAARSWGWAAAASAVLCAFAAKTGFEFVTRQTVFVDSAAATMIPIPLAHVIGALVAATCAIVSAGGMWYLVQAEELYPDNERSACRERVVDPICRHSGPC